LIVGGPGARGYFSVTGGATATVGIDLAVGTVGRNRSDAAVNVVGAGSRLEVSDRVIVGRRTTAEVMLAEGGELVGGQKIRIGTGGSLKIGNGGEAGLLDAGTQPIDNNGTIAFNHTDPFTLNEAVTGQGLITKGGPGVTTFSGAVVSQAGLNIDADSVFVNGSFTGNAVNIAAGATPGGTGVIQAPVLNSGILCRDRDWRAGFPAFG